MSLTQYLEFQEEQDMTRLFNFTRTQKMRREDVSVLEWRRGKVYIVVVEKIWIDGHLMKVDKRQKKIMNLNLISDFEEI